MAIEFVVNGKDVAFEGDPEMPLLWYLRDHARMLGVKYGCGVGACGACTVHVDGGAVRSCSMPVSAAAGSSAGVAAGVVAQAAITKTANSSNANGKALRRCFMHSS